MKTKIVIAAFSALLVFSCTSPAYLPASGKIVMNQYGSQIIVNRTSDTKIWGELIAVDSSQMIVLTDIDNLKRLDSRIVIIPLKKVEHFILRYAKAKNYWWTIPVFTAATASHGYGFIISAPVNLIVTSLVTSTGITDFQYNEKEITYDELKMFARFPQGFPPDIDITALK